MRAWATVVLRGACYGLGVAMAVAVSACGDAPGARWRPGDDGYPASPSAGTGGAFAAADPPGMAAGGWMASGSGGLASSPGVEGGSGGEATAPPTNGGAAGKPGPGILPGPGCDSTPYSICEDFETTEPGAVPAGWTAQGEANVVDEGAAHGSRALRIGARPNGARRIVTDAAPLGSQHWGRIHYRVQLPVPSVFVHSTLVALQGTGPTRGNGEYRVVDTVKQADGAHQFLYNVQPNGFEFGTGSAYDWRFDEAWHCAEWYIDGDAQAYRFFIDGTEVESIRLENGPGNYAGTDIPGVFETVKVGWNNYQHAGDGFVAWIDDVAMHDERIGCLE